MAITASALRNNIYRLLDRVATDGQPLLVIRKGSPLKISRVESATKLSRLVKHDCINGDPQSLVHMQWESEWHHDLP